MPYYEKIVAKFCFVCTGIISTVSYSRLRYRGFKGKGVNKLTQYKNKNNEIK